jgi:hypothetical protein
MLAAPFTAGGSADGGRDDKMFDYLVFNNRF